MTYEKAQKFLEIKQREMTIKRHLYNEQAIEINEINGLAIEALEKQIPKKPVIEKDKVIFDIVCGRCPECDSAVYSKTNLYCHNCGQALDWSDTECQIKK